LGSTDLAAGFAAAAATIICLFIAWRSPTIFELVVKTAVNEGRVFTTVDQTLAYAVRNALVKAVAERA